VPRTILAYVLIYEGNMDLDVMLRHGKSKMA